MKKAIKISPISAVLLMVFMNCNAQKKTFVEKVVLKNTTELQLTEMAISIKRSQFSLKEKINQYPVLIYKADTIPAQVNDLNGDGKWDELFFVADFSPNEKKTLELKWSPTNPKFPIKTSVRFGKREGKNLPVHPATEEVLMANQVHKKLGYQKYQTDGPTWENDKVGFRHYLDGRNSKDVFGKKNSGNYP